MIDFSIEHLVPRFLLLDKNGYALSQAIAAAMRILCDTVEEGVRIVTDIDAMPEWRLDEMAWETLCLYDYHGELEEKRTWIRNAVPYFRLFGTKRAAYDFLSGYYNQIEVQEAADYGGQPFHFRVWLDGDWTLERETFIRQALAQAKNVRSVMDELAIGSTGNLAVSAEADRISFPFPVADTGNLAGFWLETDL